MPSHVISGDWSPEIRAALDVLFRRHGRSSARYNPQTPPVAAFDWDNTCIYNDIGEAYYFDTVSELGYRFDLDAFWELVPDELGRDDLRGLWLRLAQCPSDEVRRLTAYNDFRTRFANLYYRTIDAMGARSAYAWIVKLLVGQRPEAILRRVEAIIERELDVSIGEDVWESSNGERVVVARGIRVFAPVAALIREAQAAGFRVVVVTASPRIVVVPFARRLGVTEVYGMTNDLDGDTLAARLIPPETYREGKVVALERYVGRLPLLAVGDAETDAEMLNAATTVGGLAALLDRGDVALRAEGKASGWMIQPRWSHGSP
jgi:phosphoserine phosphatase